jgi:hypothetical protein
LTGQTNSANLNVIATVGSYQNILNGSTENFLAKFDANGIRLWGTYYGGSDQEYGGACTSDSQGNIYLYGTTASTNAISSSGSYQVTFAGGTDTYLVKFNSSGVRLWGTYYGGVGADNSGRIAIDQQGSVFLIGWVLSGQSGLALSSSGCHQSTFGGGMTDLFIAKFNSNGTRLWGTYYGGNNRELIGQCATDIMGNLYIVGSTESQDGVSIATANSHQPNHGDNINFIGRNGFLAKFNSSGVRQWATYYGGQNGTGGYCCAVDKNGDVYMGGETIDTLVIATPFCHQPFVLQNAGFLSKFNSNGQRLWGTYYGNGTSLRDCISDNLNNIYFVGTTASPINYSLICTPNSHQTLYGGGNSDLCFVKFDQTGVRQWGSFYGGSDLDNFGLPSIAFSSASNGGIYIAGGTSSSNGTSIASSGSHQSNLGGGVGVNNAFIAKFNDCTSPAPVSCVGIKEFQNNYIELNIFPNPSNGDFTIKAESELNLKVINELGQILQTINLNNYNNYSANVSNLNAGIYFITSNNGRVKEKIVVIK